MWEILRTLAELNDEKVRRGLWENPWNSAKRNLNVTPAI
jgi:hypothetical protein